MMTLAPVLFALLVLVSAPPLGAEEVKIVGRDFSFDAPNSLPAGLTTFVFENTGAVRHEMNIRLLRQGVTEQQIIDAHQAGMPLRKQMEQFADGEVLGILIARPREGSSGKLLVHLISGRTYLVLCQLEEPQGMPRHNILGMYKTFRVE